MSNMLKGARRRVQRKIRKDPKLREALKPLVQKPAKPQDPTMQPKPMFPPEVQQRLDEAQSRKGPTTQADHRKYRAELMRMMLQEQTLAALERETGLPRERILEILQKMPNEKKVKLSTTDVHSAATAVMGELKPKEQQAASLAQARRMAKQIPGATVHPDGTISVPPTRQKPRTMGDLAKMTPLMTAEENPNKNPK